MHYYHNFTVIVGVKNPAIIAYNERAKARWHEKTREFDRLNSQPRIATLANSKLTRSFSLVAGSQSEFERRRRLRDMRDYFDEVLDLVHVADDIIIADFKSSSPLYLAQKRRALNDRVKIGDSERPIKQVVLDLISKPEHADKRPSELWPHFVCLLRELGCSPIEFTNVDGGTAVKYDFPRAKDASKRNELPKRTMTLGTFRNLVAKLRGAHLPS